MGTHEKPFNRLVQKIDELKRDAVITEDAITHGDPASFVMPLQIGKTPLVIPRQHKFNEHVNDHQVEFARNVAERMGTIIAGEDIDKLGDVNRDYDHIVSSIGHCISSNNEKFNEELEEIVNRLRID